LFDSICVNASPERRMTDLAENLAEDFFTPVDIR
jgi:hypothetical protein